MAARSKRVPSDDDIDEFLRFSGKSSKAKFEKMKSAAMGKMNDQGIQLLEDNDEPYALVIVNRDSNGEPTGHHICIGFAGSLEDGQALAKGLENAREQLLKTLVAAKLNIDPE